MKKMKLFLLAAMIIGMGSAFTTAPTNDPQYWVKAANGDAITLEAAQGLDGYCDHEVDEPYCVYDNFELTSPVPAFGIGRFVYP